ncbi:Hypothetical_protein [Hexamita inflata]|uniref:Hypothetical_protein n=1 Tax=Hexamita inflata TaxID=28002 RepID=A0ABP1HBH6_9EUKA
MGLLYDSIQAWANQLPFARFNLQIYDATIRKCVTKPFQQKGPSKGLLIFALKQSDTSSLYTCGSVKCRYSQLETFMLSFRFQQLQNANMRYIFCEVKYKVLCHHQISQLKEITFGCALNVQSPISQLKSQVAGGLPGIRSGIKGRGQISDM